MNVVLPNTWVRQQYQYLKHGGDNPVVNKKMTLGQVVTNFTGQVVASCARVCVQHHSCIHHTSPETMHLYVYITRKCLSFFIIFLIDKNFLQNVVLSYIATH